MLKVFGHIYSNSENDFETIKNALEREGYMIAYEGSVNSGEILKNVDDLNGDNRNAES